MKSSVKIESLKWTQVLEFLRLRREIETENNHLALGADDRKSEPIWFALGRIFANRKWVVTLIAKDRDEFIGYISVSFARFRKMRANAYIVLSVRSNYRGKGIGTSLMEEAEKIAHGRGIRRLELEVFSKNIGAHGLFKRLGYEEEGRKRRAAQVHDGFDDLILMAKFLDEFSGKSPLPLVESQKSSR